MCGETHRIHVLWGMASVSVEALRVWRRMAWEGVEGHQAQPHCIIHYQETSRQSDMYIV